MSRMRLVEHADLPPDLQEVVREAEDAAGEAWVQYPLRILAHDADTLRAFNAFYFELFANNELGLRVTELVRLAIAQISRCPNCMAARYTAGTPDELPDDVVAALPAADRSPHFDAREKAAVRFAQKLASDHFTVGDDDYAELHRHFTEKQIVQLGMLITVQIGIGRFVHSLQATDQVCTIPLAAGA